MWKNKFVQTTKNEFKQFLSDNFKGLRLRKPLFYSWCFGLRFDLQLGNTDTDEYFHEVTRRASNANRNAERTAPPKLSHRRPELIGTR